MSVTLSSTGETGLYDVILKKGTVSETFGSPVVFDVDNITDAQSLMEKSADAINAYLLNVARETLSFAESGITGF